jgi:hypothetical protein
MFDLSSQTFCPQCGTANVLGARFCIKCGSQLTATAQPPISHVPVPTSPVPGPAPAYNYSNYVANQEKITRIDRTSTGLLLLIIGELLSPLPYVVYVGGVLTLIGAILVIMGRNAFSRLHSRNVVWSIILYVVGLAVIIGAVVSFVFAVFSATFASNAATQNPATFSQSLSSSFQLALIGAAIGGGISSIAYVLFTYALQDKTGRILLWAGYIAGLTVSAVVFIVVSPLISNTASQAFTGGTFNPAPFNNLQTMEQLIGLLNFMPAILYSTALYKVRSRINRGEVLKPTAQPTSPNTLQS